MWIMHIHRNVIQFNNEDTNDDKKIYAAIFLTHVINSTLQRGKLVGKMKARKTKRRNSSSLSPFNIRDLGVSSYSSVKFVTKQTIRTAK